MGLSEDCNDRVVELRNVEYSDLERLFEIQLSPQANERAVTYPRSRASFDSHWHRSLEDPLVVTRVIVVDDAIAGTIAKLELNGRPHLGYWLSPEYWGRGIATNAGRLFLREYRQRPLWATAAESNSASCRVLEKLGFHFIERAFCMETDRYPACWESVYLLDTKRSNS